MAVGERRLIEKKIKKINTLSKEEKIIPYLLRLLVKVEELEML